MDKKNIQLIEIFCKNLYEKHIKKFQNEARHLNNIELLNSIMNIALHTIDLVHFVNNGWLADKNIEGNLLMIIKNLEISDTKIPQTEYDPNKSTTYLNTIVGFLHQNGIERVDFLVDGININPELEKLQ